MFVCVCSFSLLFVDIVVVVVVVDVVDDSKDRDGFCCLIITT